MDPIERWRELRRWHRAFDGSQPVVWYIKAAELAAASEALRQGPLRQHLPMQDQALLLLGYAIENLLKGLILQAGKAMIEQGEKQPGEITGHDLGKLAESAGEHPSAKEAELLARLTTYTVWRGKYPVPIDDKGYHHLPLSLPDDFSRAWTYYRRLAERFKVLCDRIVEDDPG